MDITRLARRWALSLVAGILLALASPRPAGACSVTSEFLPPSSYELVRLADQIVLARATSVAPGGVVFEVVEALRGSALAPKSAITVEGDTTRYLGAGTPDDFSKARPGAFSGGCVAGDYRLRGEFLLFLQAKGSAWSPLFIPFARVNEEVTSPLDPWLATVRRYARVAKLGDPVKERAELERLGALAKRSPSADLPAPMAEDIARHLILPNKYKSFVELKAIYDAAPPDRTRARALTAIAVRGDAAAGPFMAQILKQAQADPPGSTALLGPLASFYEKLPDSQHLQDLADLYVKLGTALKQARWQIMWTLIRRAGKEHRPAMFQALVGADDEEAGRLAAWFPQFPSPEAQAHLVKRLGNDFENKTDLAFAVAAMGVKAPLDWALAALKTPRTPPGAPSSAKPDSRWVAIYIVARSPLPEADRAAVAIIAARGEDLVSLLQGYSGAVHPHAAQRLQEIAALPDLDDDARRWLARTTKARAASP